MSLLLYTHSDINVTLTAVVERVNIVVGNPRSVLGLCPCIGSDGER
jgi:hypothetical protein